MSAIPAGINLSINKRISDLCPFSISKNSGQNHCAHYVSHMMGYEFSGPTCKTFTWEDKQNPARGATIRVDDLFSRCTETGLLADKPDAVVECLLFVTIETNVRKAGEKLVMGNHPRKHVGILTGGRVWNYSNSTGRVVADLLDMFKSKFTSAYDTKGTTVEFYFGKFI